jgi:pepF/M3 family oligoendopeptidase
MTNKMHWDLSPLYPGFDSPEFKKDQEDLKKFIEEQTNWAVAELENNVDSQKKIETILDSTEHIYSTLQKLSAYTQLSLSTDATNAVALSTLDKLQPLSLAATNYSKITASFIGKQENLSELIESSAKLKEFEFFLNETAQAATHLLGNEIEPIIARLNLTGGTAWERMRDMIDGTMTVAIEVDGEMQDLPLPIVRNMAYDADPDVRKKAYEAELASYPKVDLPLAHAINAIKGESITLSEIRGFGTVMNKTLEESRMEQVVLDAMLSAMVDFMPDFRRYLKAKAKFLGHQNGLPFYDLFAPIGDEEALKHYSYDEARETLVKVFSTFSKEMADFIDNAFEKRWIDAESRKGKSGGAFCSNLPMIGESRVLANFDGSYSQLSTLAHELGHAWHGNCLKDQPILKTDYPMPVAETASIFNEGILMAATLTTATEEQKFTLLETELQDATQVIVDIYSRYLFETELIDTRKDQSMTVDDLKQAMLDAQKATYGDGLDPDYMHAYMWACKPHYYSTELAFYNWPYAFGLLFSKGVYAQYKKIGPDFVEDYNALLTATGSASVVDVAARIGIDIRQKDFWVQSLSEIKSLIDQFCELVDKKVK